MNVVEPSAEYRICTRCVMDTTDPDITFDEDGVCSHCRAYPALIKTFVSNDAERADRLERLVQRIKASGKRHEYDCVIGLSGGVDSSYVAYLVTRELGLRPLAVHLDNGWNSELAVANIQTIIQRLGIDLYTEVLDWNEFRDLQLSFLRASTPDSEIPTDHAITAILMRIAKQHKIKYIIGGSNIRSEAIMPRAWSQGIRDWRYISSVQKRFGTRELATFPHFSIFRFAWNKLSGQRWVNILDYVDYRKTDVVHLLERELGWKPYSGKHHESVYTKFFQSYILPVKFGFDKRKGHLASLINSGEISRAEALAELERPVADPAEIAIDHEFVAKKLGLTLAELDEIMRLPPKTMRDYPCYETTWWLKFLRAAYRAPRLVRSLRHPSA